MMRQICNRFASDDYTNRKENMKIRQEVYKDEEIQKWIEKIKSHKWVKIIEKEE